MAGNGGHRRAAADRFDTSNTEGAGNRPSVSETARVDQGLSSTHGVRLNDMAGLKVSIRHCRFMVDGRSLRGVSSPITMHSFYISDHKPFFHVALFQSAHQNTHPKWTRLKVHTVPLKATHARGATATFFRFAQ